jgi:hypothetical protein
METIGTWWMWSGFLVIGLIMLANDPFRIPLTVSLGVAAAIIATSIILSLKMYARERGRADSIEETNAQ